ncbi:MULTISPECIES: flagellar hook-basal body complex protein FliE [unclassified Massilia]|uniref:flagellar hook-basal body complex protein FliE n=1 Tax=unclassified Massilia TaxID=2609279 RepID=UPI001780EA65|nr:MULTISPECIES: flagellar hook-basal body complex protein FliE [unclassified Massilia]MBD8528834.1 flagellar hook-basal body complex protein FliE [Massilia sp. CFBP 13647]MBD8673476.1 flagellar hook-basal body complex protein FliE [Massilia sp. CFBP 13721]
MSIGGIGGIDGSRIEAMMAQLKAAATKPAAPSLAPGGPGALGGLGGGGAVNEGPSKVSFSDALKNSLEQVSNSQKHAEELGQKFAMGDDSVSLSDTMIAMQKSSIAFQATVQVRNKLVSAYHEIMNMQV